MVVNLNALFSCYTVTLCFYGSMTKYPSIKPPLDPYQKALEKCRYWYNLHYEPPTTNKMKKQTMEQQTLVQLPFSKNVSTNIGHKFLALVDKHFPKDHKLRKIFNCNTIKISYSCMNNTKQIINNHNKCILNSSKHIYSITSQMTPTQKTKKLATADRRTYAHSMETASNHH